MSVPALRWIAMKRPNALGVKLQRNRHGGAPLSGPLAASTPGWTARRLRVGSGCAPMELGARSHPSITPSHGANRLPPGRSAPTSAGGEAGVERTGMQAPLGTLHRAYQSLTGSPPRSPGHSPLHATCSHSRPAGGGTPTRGMSAVHTSRCPQTGQRSGCASPRSSQTLCQSKGGGASTGPCPSC